LQGLKTDPPPFLLPPIFIIVWFLLWSHGFSA
jgi:hypothetical protein